MIDHDPSLGEEFLTELQDIEDYLSELAMTANAMLPDLERRFPGSARRPAELVRDRKLIHARELLAAIARSAEHLASTVDGLALAPSSFPPVPADERLTARLDGLAARADSSTPGLGL